MKEYFNNGIDNITDPFESPLPAIQLLYSSELDADSSNNSPMCPHGWSSAPEPEPRGVHENYFYLRVKKQYWDCSRTNISGIPYIFIFSLNKIVIVLLVKNAYPIMLLTCNRENGGASLILGSRPVITEEVH